MPNVATNALALNNRVVFFFDMDYFYIQWLNNAQARGN